MSEHQHTPPGGPRPAADGSTEQPRTDAFFDSVRRLGVVRADQRWVGGVAAGLARRWDIDPLLIRGALVVLTIFGGLGLLLYGLAWALLPEEHDGRIHAQEALQGRFDAALAGALIMVVIGMARPTLWWNSYWWFGGWGALLTVAALAGVLLAGYMIGRRNGQDEAPAAAPRTGTTAAAGQGAAGSAESASSPGAAQTQPGGSSPESARLDPSPPESSMTTPPEPSTGGTAPTSAALVGPLPADAALAPKGPPSPEDPAEPEEPAEPKEPAGPDAPAEDTASSGPDTPTETVGASAPTEHLGTGAPTETLETSAPTEHLEAGPPTEVLEGETLEDLSPAPAHSHHGETPGDADPVDISTDDSTDDLAASSTDGPSGEPSAPAASVPLWTSAGIKESGSAETPPDPPQSSSPRETSADPGLGATATAVRPARTTAPARPRTPGPGSTTVRVVVGLALLAAAVLLLLGRFTDLDAALWLLAGGAILAVLGLGMVISGLRGRRAGWLGAWSFLTAILVVPIALTLAVAPHVRDAVSLNPSMMGDSHWSPSTAEELAGGHVHTAGSAVVSLRDIPAGTTLDEPARIALAAGVLVVNVPAGLDVSIEVQGTGALRVISPEPWYREGNQIRSSYDRALVASTTTIRPTAASGPADIDLVVGVGAGEVVIREVRPAAPEDDSGATASRETDTDIADVGSADAATSGDDASTEATDDTTHEE